MILDNLHATLCTYENMHFGLARGLEWLRRTDLDSLEMDKTITIDGSRVFALTQTYRTKPRAEQYFEAHRSYIDIQIVLAGEEELAWAPVAALPTVYKPYSFERDVVYFEDPAAGVGVPFVLRAGDFAVFFPSDGHKTRCAATEPGEVRKIVLKVSV